MTRAVAFLLALAGDAVYAAAVVLRRGAVALERLAGRFDSAWLAWTGERDGGR